MLGFIIWSIVAIIFVLIGVSAWKSKQEVGFFTFTKPPKISNIEKYNHAVGKLWIVFAVILELLGTSFLFTEQNSPLFLFVILGVIILIIATIFTYLKIEKRYKV